MSDAPNEQPTGLTPEERRLLTPARAPKKSNLPTRQTSLNPAVSKRTTQQRPERKPVDAKEYARRLARAEKRDKVLIEEQKKKRLNSSEEDWRKLVGPRFREATTENPTIVNRVNRIAAGSDAPTSVILYGKQLGTGKAQPVSEPVLTPDGYVPMGDLLPGSVVVGSNGAPTQVLEVFPQGVRPIYQVMFDDDTYVYCDADHLWQVYDDIEDKVKVLTAAKLKETGFFHLNDNYLRYALPLLTPVQYPTRNFDADPYEAAVALVKRSWQVTPDAAATWDGLSPYLLGDVSQRLAALQGVIAATEQLVTDDADLSGIDIPVADLADNVADLIRSLGGKARVAMYTTRGQTLYRIMFALPELAAYETLGQQHTWAPQHGKALARKIVAITYSHDEQAQCIRVAAADHLYVTRHYTLTHNTWQGYAFINLAIKSGAVSPGQVYAGTENAVLGRISVAGFNRSAYMEELLNSKYKIYFIDDVGLGHFGAGNSEQSRRQVWYELINHVYMHDLTIILTTNKDITPDSLGAWLGDQAYDRLRGLVGINGLIEPGKVNRRPGIAQEREEKERR